MRARKGRTRTRARQGGMVRRTGRGSTSRGRFCWWPGLACMLLCSYPCVLLANVEVVNTIRYHTMPYNTIPTFVVLASCRVVSNDARTHARLSVSCFFRFGDTGRDGTVRYGTGRYGTGRDGTGRTGAQHQYDDAADGGAGARQGRRVRQGPLQPALPVARGQIEHHHLRAPEVHTYA